MEHNQLIKTKIYAIRGLNIMLDRDLAHLYQIETKYLKKQVNRNKHRFPNDFMFQLTDEELRNWRFQNVTSNSDKMGLRYSPYAFTELGVAMLSSVLNSHIAIDINIKIMRTFVEIRQLVINNPQYELLHEKVKRIESEQTTIRAEQDSMKMSQLIDIKRLEHKMTQVSSETHKMSQVLDDFKIATSLLNDLKKANPNPSFSSADSNFPMYS